MRTCGFYRQATNQQINCRTKTNVSNVVHIQHRIAIQKLGKLSRDFFFSCKNRASQSHFDSHASIECACQKAIKRPKSEQQVLLGGKYGVRENEKRGGQK